MRRGPSPRRWTDDVRVDPAADRGSQPLVGASTRHQVLDHALHDAEAAVAEPQAGALLDELLEEGQVLLQGCRPRRVGGVAQLVGRGDRRGDDVPELPAGAVGERRDVDAGGGDDVQGAQQAELRVVPSPNSARPTRRPRAAPRRRTSGRSGAPGCRGAARTTPAIRCT